MFNSRPESGKAKSHPADGKPSPELLFVDHQISKSNLLRIRLTLRFS
jgi:hypothetical protein